MTRDAPCIGEEEVWDPEPVGGALCIDGDARGAVSVLQAGVVPLPPVEHIHRELLQRQEGCD